MTIESSAETDRQPLYLTGTYVAKLDAKKRIKIPKQIMDSLIALNGAQRKIFLTRENGEDKIIGFTLPAVGKLRKELGDLPLTDPDTRKKMEILGSSLFETDISKEDRVTIPDDILSKLEIRIKSDVLIKGAFEFITISKNGV
jgi:DNA-binding transcriptional regulator/RsmH inhibitor MraZ